MLAALLVAAAMFGEGTGDRALTGVVRDDTGGVVAGASVRIQCVSSAGDLLVTDARGMFTADRLPAERCTVEVRRNGFASRTIDADLSGAPAVPLDVVLAVEPFVTNLTVRTTTPGMDEFLFAVPQGASALTRTTLAGRPFQLLPQALREEPGILAQSTTASQGSPIVRGLTGQRNVYLVDGVRFNTAAWRDGPSQYMAWIAPAVLEQLEIVRGPGSVQYGSDALGAALNALTVAPAFTTQGVSVGGELEGSFASATRGGDIHGTLRIDTPRAAVRAGLWTLQMDDLRAGGGRDSHAAVTRFLGLPSSVLGSRLLRTGFRQRSGFVSAAARLRSATLTASYMHSGQHGSSRYDRIFGGAGIHRSEFAPQALDLAFARVSGRVPFFDEAAATVSMNRQSDGRLEQSRPTAAIDQQVTRTTAMGYHAQASKALGARHHLLVGGEAYDEYIGGARTITDAAGTVRRERPDIPDGTRYVSTSLFGQSLAEVIPGRLTLRGGLRYGRFSFSSRPDHAMGVAEERVTTGAFTFSSGVVAHLTPTLNLVGSVSRGFRTANAFDLGGIGLSGGGFEISPMYAADLGAIRGTTDGATAVTTGSAIGSLRPERLTAYEGGFKLQTARVSGSLILFDLEMRDSIDRRTLIFDRNVVGTTIAGFEIVRQDSAGRAFVAADPRPIVSRVNIHRNRIRGVDANGTVALGATVRLRAHVSVANGRDLATGAFMRRMPPVMGGTAVRWQPRSWWLEGAVQFAARQSRFSDGDISDVRIGASRTRAAIASFFNGSAVDLGLVRGGLLSATGETLAQVQDRLLGSAASAAMFNSTRGWTTLGARLGVPINAHLDLTVVAENLLDRNYRLHGSGVDEPGFNVQVRTRVRF